MSYTSRRGGPPSWFVFLIAIAIVFGVYYVFIGVRDYITSGGLSRMDATQAAAVEATATIEQRLQQNPLPTRRPTGTPTPECQTFIVSVPSAIVRDQPTTAGRLLDSLPEGTEVCVIQREGETSWYLIDLNTLTNRIEAAFMRDDLIVPLNPTPTPSDTPLPIPSITLTFTPSPTLTPTATSTLDPDATTLEPDPITPEDVPISS